MLIQMIHYYVSIIRNKTNALKIPPKFYNHCVRYKVRVPKIISSNRCYLWVDMDDKEGLDELLLEADFMSRQDNRALAFSANALTRAYNNNCKERN